MKNAHRSGGRFPFAFDGVVAEVELYLDSIQLLTTFDISAIKNRGGCMEPLVARPQPGIGGQRDGRQQVYVHVSQAFAMNPMAVDECQYFFRLGDRCHWKMAQQVEHHRTVRKTAASDLADHERMGKHARVLEQRAQARVAATQVVDPDGRVDEDQDFGD
jgi:hypothetical protein